MIGRSNERAEASDGDSRGRDGRRHSEDGEDIEDIAADDVADGQVALTANGGHERRRDLRQRGAYGHQGQTDDQLADAEAAGDGRSSLDQPARTHREHSETRESQQSGSSEPARPTGLCDIRRKALSASLPEEKAEVEQEDRHHRDSLGSGNHTVAPKEQRYRGDRDHDRHVQPHQLAVDGEGGNDCGEAEYEEDIEDVASDDVAESEIPAACAGRCQAGRKLRGAGAEGDNGETDDQRRDPQRRGEPRGSSYEGHGTAQEQRETCKKPKISRIDIIRRRSSRSRTTRPYCSRGLVSPVGSIATSFELVDHLGAVREAGPEQNAGQRVTAARGYEGAVCQHVELARVVRRFQRGVDAETLLDRGSETRCPRFGAASGAAEANFDLHGAA